MGNRRPNLILFNPDQFRADALGHLGNPAARTPVMDRLALEEGVSFRNAFCQNPVCTPSRCSFMTGWYPHVRGHRTMYHMLAPEEPMLLRTLKDSGYFVWWGGKNDVVPGQNGFTAYCDVKYQTRLGLPELHAQDEWRGAPEGDNYYSFYAGRRENVSGTEKPDGDWDILREAVAQLKTISKDRPFCMYLPLLYPHPPYGVEEPFFSAIDRKELPPRIPCPDGGRKPSLLSAIRRGQRLEGWTEERYEELRATYLGMCARVDTQLGMLLEALKENGLYEETAVLVFSDHGDFTGDYGLVEKTQNTFEDCLTRVPLLIKPPSRVPFTPGIREGLTELVDIPATVYALCGLSFDYTQFGESLLPRLADPALPGRPYVVCEGGRNPEEEHCSEVQSVSQGEKGLYYPRIHAQVSDDVAHGKAFMLRTLRYKYVYRLYEQDELYDLETDPREIVNRAGDPALAAVETLLRGRLLEFLARTADVVPWKADQR